MTTFEEYASEWERDLQSYQELWTRQRIDHARPIYKKIFDVRLTNDKTIEQFLEDLDKGYKIKEAGEHPNGDEENVNVDVLQKFTEKLLLIGGPKTEVHTIIEAGKLVQISEEELFFAHLKKYKHGFPYKVPESKEHTQIHCVYSPEDKYALIAKFFQEDAIDINHLPNSVRIVLHFHGKCVENKGMITTDDGKFVAIDELTATIWSYYEVAKTKNAYLSFCHITITSCHGHKHTKPDEDDFYIHSIAKTNHPKPKFIGKSFPKFEEHIDDLQTESNNTQAKKETDETSPSHDITTTGINDLEINDG